MSASIDYWDSPSNTKIRLYDFVKAMTTGQQVDGGENAKIDF